MKRIILITAVMTFYYYVSAQDVVVKEMQNAASKEIKSLDSNGWHKNGLFILNLYQGALGNWVAGGRNQHWG